MGVDGVVQLGVGAFPAEPGEREAQGLVGLLESAAGAGKNLGELAAHADGLRALAWKDEGGVAGDEDGHGAIVAKNRPLLEKKKGCRAALFSTV